MLSTWNHSQTRNLYIISHRQRSRQFLTMSISIMNSIIVFYCREVLKFRIHTCIRIGCFGFIEQPNLIIKYMYLVSAFRLHGKQYLYVECWHWICISNRLNTTIPWWGTLINMQGLFENALYYVMQAVDFSSCLLFF